MHRLPNTHLHNTQIHQTFNSVSVMTHNVSVHQFLTNILQLLSESVNFTQILKMLFHVTWIQLQVNTGTCQLLESTNVTVHYKKKINILNSTIHISDGPLCSHISSFYLSLPSVRREKDYFAFYTHFVHNC